MPTPAPSVPTAPPDPRRWWALILLAVADFVVILDATIVNVALPTIGTDLHAGTGDLAWVVSAYVLAFGGLLLLGGRLADLFGRRRLFIAGLTLFGLASLAGGFATSIEQLIAARVVQGIGAAALAPAARSMLTVVFPAGAERARAMGVWAAVAGSGSVVGLVLGGILTTGLGWAWVLWVNVPIVLIAAAITPRLLDESRADAPDRSVDVVGAVLVTGSLVSALYALVQAGEAGWGSAQTVGLLALAAGLLALFVLVESRVAAPLVPLQVFRLGDVRGANIAMTVMAAAMVGLFFVLVLYTQQVLGWSALTSGLSQLPMGLALMTVAGLAGPLTERIGAKPVLVLGLAVFTAGLAWYAQLPAHGSYVADLLGPSLVVATGLGLAFVALTVASVSGVDPDHLGLAGGLITTTQQIGGALGLAIVTAVVASQTHGDSAGMSGIDDGLRAALFVVAGVAAVATVLAMVLMPARRRPVAGPASAGALTPAV